MNSPWYINVVAMNIACNRFVTDLIFLETEQKPVQLLKLFDADCVSDLLQIARCFPSDLNALMKEMSASSYLSTTSIQESFRVSVSQKKLPAECAFALRACTYSEVREKLNHLLLHGKDLNDFRHLCVCLVKGLALLPPCYGTVFCGSQKVHTFHL